MGNDIAITSLKEKIDALNQEAWEARVNDSPKAFELSQQSVKLARDNNYPKGLAEGLRSLGFGYIRLFKNEEAAPLLRESLSLFQTLNDLKGQAVVYEYLGIIERNWGNLGHSLELLLKGNELVQKVGPIEVEITSCYQIGVTYKHLGDHENALDYLYRSLSLAEKINLTLMVAYSTNIIGSIYFDNSNYEKALELYQQGLVIRRQSNDKWGEAGSLDNIGFTYLKLNDLDKAIDYCKQSLAISQSTDDKKGEANALLHLAEIYEQANDIKQASKFSNKSLAIRKARGDKRGEAEVLLFLAELHKNTNDVDDKQIFEWISGALNIANEIKSLDILSKAFFNLHQYYQDKGNYKKSLAQLESHLHIEKELHKNAINQKVSNLEISYKAEAINQQNKELTELNRQIEKANAELKVERSLERVRTAAMAMKEPSDMLEVCKIISHELASLNVKEIRNVQTAIFYEEKGSYMNYEYYAKHDKTFVTEVDYENHPVAKKFGDQMLKGANQVWIHQFNGQEVKEWLIYQRTTNVFIDTFLETAESLNYYWYSLGPVALGMSTYVPLNEEEIDLFKRFRNVFELAYRRYLDIEKALAQAKEAQIEVALERIRARAMAMHSSNEIMDVANILREQMGLLNQPDLETSVVNLLDEDSENVHSWHAFRQPGSSEKIISGTLSFPKNSSELAREMVILYKEGKKEFTIEASGKRLEEFTQVLINAEPEIEKYTSIKPPLKVYYHFAIFRGGTLLTVSYQPPTEDVKSLQRRAASVFDMAYRRYLDLRNAEAQAREAQIEAAVERIRSKALAMQNSTDLNALISHLFEEATRLDFVLDRCIVMIIDPQTLDTTWILSNPETPTQPTSHLVKYHEHKPYLAHLDAWKSRNEKWTYILEGEEKKKWDQFLFYKTELSNLPTPAKEAMQSFSSVRLNSSFSNFGGIILASFEPINESQYDILIRFTKVFDLTYTRFNDLKQAEAQAKEAKIEAALERVRARTMGMHHSDDLTAVINVVKEQLVQLGFHFDAVNFVTDITERGYYMWLDAPGQSSAWKIYVPRVEYLGAGLYRQAIQEGRDFFTYTLNKEEKDKFFKNLFENTIVKTAPEQEKREVYDAIGMSVSVVLLKKILFSIQNFKAIPYTDEENAIIKRFAYVFEQSYTRFLDLQKAEAQARESQIQLALERVRARTMAMQHSNELAETTAVLFQQLKILSEDLSRSFICFFKNEATQIEMWATTEDGKKLNDLFIINVDKHQIFQTVVAEWKQNKKQFILELQGKELLSYQEYLHDELNIPFKKDQKKRVMTAAFFSKGYVGLSSTETQSEDIIQLLHRFAAVFDLTYTRFLDLQKAEAQAKEAQIETGLERVRSKTMAMHKSEEVTAVAVSLNEELMKLGFEGGSSIIIIDERTGDTEQWTGFSEDKSIKNCYVPYFKHPYHDALLDAWKNGKTFLVYTVAGDEKGSLDEHYFSTGYKIFPENDKKWMRQMESVTFSHAFMKYGAIHWGPKHLTEEQLKILQRFSNVFEQSYTRFLDLKKAEAQAREAKIEASLERVRSRSLAMHKSDELEEVIMVISEQLQQLQFRFHNVSFGIINEQQGLDFWIASPGQPLPFLLKVPYINNKILTQVLKARNDGVDFFADVISAEENKKWLQHLFEHSILKNVSEENREYLLSTKSLTRSVVLKKYILLAVVNYAGVPYSDEQNAVFKRFANVFDQAYTRFLDLQKAEAQAREAQIEASLERVRSRTIGMQKSDELQSAALLLFQQIQALGARYFACGFNIWDEDRKTATAWMAREDKLLPPFKTSSSEDVFLEILEAAKRGELLFVKEQVGQELEIHYRYMASIPIFKDILEEMKQAGLSVPTFQIIHCAFFAQGYLMFISFEPVPEAYDIFKRFAKAFEQTYTRFLDLQKAEAQAREAKIEAALEKVRTSTMAMQKSDDLSQTAFVLFNQFKELGEAPERIFIATFDDHDSGLVDLWGTDQGGNKLNKLFKLPVNEPTMVSKIIAAWKEKKKSIVVDIKGEELKTYLGFLKKAGIPVAEGIMVDRRVQTAACFSNGVIGVTTSEPQSVESVQLQERFAGVFDLTYRRFLDLQKAEAQAHQARIETALERVRARALAMQQPEELKNVAEVLRYEMGLLGVEELETCSIYIHEKDSETAECWYALKDPNETGKKMLSDHFHLVLNDTWVGREMKKFYNSGEMQTSIVMQGANRKEWINYCYQHSPVFSGFYGEVIPDRTYHLYKFSHGYIGAAAPGEISNESWKLLNRAASVFSLAYSRFRDLTQARNDLIKLKEEKKRAEDALTELQITQKQLIQTEKMASLGELTAGIAHEIQNPLNFVNNFSDVSNELLEEMKEELSTGNMQSAMEIAENVKDNLEKILHHGKRADAIVKSMLQHSRSSSGSKEPTDINNLADEYLRLAFHGFRAKDKSFNAKFETDFDSDIEKVNIIPQDLGRVMLNLINNAFYAVSEKKNKNVNGYEPLVTISTKKIDDKVEIKVKDNGDGISQKVLDKIFQPFFTTKPTGQGTGLGLSLSYDIVTKGHGGDIKVKTKEGAGSEFIISLPIN